jgi:4-hydroxybenzoate polyprenyltransferase
VVAFLTALVLMMAGFIYNFNNPLIWAAIFSYEVNLIREMVKDIEDVKGDHQFGLHTLPIQLGIRSTKQVITTIYILFFTTCWVPVFLHFHRHAEILWEYVSASLLLVQLPILFLIFHLQRAYVIPADFAVHSRYVKILIFLGMVSILFLR